MGKRRCSWRMPAMRNSPTSRPGRSTSMPIRRRPIWAPTARPLVQLRRPRPQRVEQTDWHGQEEHRFAKLVGQLDDAVKVGEVKSLVIVAPPRTLGVLRQAYSHTLRAACMPKSTRTWSGFPCTRSRSISRGDAFPATVMPRAGGASSRSLQRRRRWAVVATPPWPAPSAACRHCRTGWPRRPCRARAVP